MKYAPRIGCIFVASVLLASCQTNPSMHNMTSTELTKAQSIETGVTFDRNEMAVAKLAKKRAVKPQVKHFANHVYDHYSADLHKKLKYVKREHITLEPSSVDNDLKMHGKNEMARLEATSHHHFDKEFIKEIIEDQQGAIQYFDKALRNETNPHAIAALKAERKHAEMCLEKARHIQKTLG